MSGVTWRAADRFYRVWDLGGGGCRLGSAGGETGRSNGCDGLLTLYLYAVQSYSHNIQLPHHIALLCFASVLTLVLFCCILSIWSSRGLPNIAKMSWLTLLGKRPRQSDSPHRVLLGRKLGVQSAYKVQRNGVVSKWCRRSQRERGRKRRWGRRAWCPYSEKIIDDFYSRSEIMYTVSE